MLPFLTEFPVVPSDNRARFVAEVVAWIRGMRHQTVLSTGSTAELDGTNVHVRSNTGEELRMRELQTVDGWTAIGIRHDLPDDLGRAWRTECVLKRGAADGGQDLVRLRTQCIATIPGARLDSPRKPYLIKALLKGGWGGTDQELQVSDRPVWLERSDRGLAIAKSVTLGETAKWLPTVYISATGNNSWLLGRQAIEKLAYDLGGIAHVMVEPDRNFSFDLRHESEARNAYGGTIGLSIPGKGIARQYYLGWQIQNEDGLATAVKLAASALRSQMPAFGWDWTELQEQALRAQRERDRNRLTTAENDKLYLDEIDNLKDRILQLEQQLIVSPAASLGADQAEFSTDNLVRRIGPEAYSGEISDRLRFAAKTTLSVADRIGLDARSKAILQRVVERLPASPALTELSQDLARATKDPRRVTNELTALLARHGYSEKSDNRHVRLEARNGYDGLDSITLPKTPSDDRGLKNLRKQIERTLGITKLDD